MKAIITKAYGSSDVLEIGDLDKPTIGEKDLIIECPLFLEEAYGAVYDLLKSHKKRVTAVITSDHISLSIYTYCSS